MPKDPLTCRRKKQCQKRPTRHSVNININKKVPTNKIFTLRWRAKKKSSSQITHNGAQISTWPHPSNVTMAANHQWAYINGGKLEAPPSHKTWPKVGDKSRKQNTAEASAVSTRGMTTKERTRARQDMSAVDVELSFHLHTPFLSVSQMFCCV